MRNDDDVLARLRAADPILGADLSRTDRGALDDLREGIMLTDRGTPARRERWGTLSRGGVVAVMAALLLGGGVAYATYQQIYTPAGIGDVSCLTEWAGPEAEARDGISGPDLTGDPVADCRLYREQSGRPPIPDPVVFRFNENVYVAPRSQVPPSAIVMGPAAPRDTSVRELKSVLGDWVDGMNSRCFSETEAIEFAREQLSRLGLEGWRFKVIPPNPQPGDPGGPCSYAEPDGKNNTVDVYPNRQRDLNVKNTGTVDPFVYELRDALREGIASRCVGLDEAESLARQALGTTKYRWPLAVMPDPAASCTRVDLEVAGSIQITLRGPKVANP
ncbi:hypothetical protein [Streptosporangium sp. NPDC049078]|uniref:hypothetical protein n=1 Tax=Streptosporangium sp. NPDC049078 TaxID=3155767 RepID=UPI003412D57D